MVRLVERVLRINFLRRLTSNIAEAWGCLKVRRRFYGEEVDLGVSGNHAVDFRIALPPRVVSPAMMMQETAVLAEVLFKLLALHAFSPETTRLEGLARASASVCLASRAMATASSSVRPWVTSSRSNGQVTMYHPSCMRSTAIAKGIP